jgi:hypothetical protein
VSGVEGVLVICGADGVGAGREVEVEVDVSLESAAVGTGEDVFDLSLSTANVSFCESMLNTSPGLIERRFSDFVMGTPSDGDMAPPEGDRGVVLRGEGATRLGPGETPCVADGADVLDGSRDGVASCEGEVGMLRSAVEGRGEGARALDPTVARDSSCGRC